MVNEAIIHEQTRDFVYPIERNKLAVRLRAKRGDLKKCILIYWNRHKFETVGQIRAEMNCYARDKMYDYFETVIDTIEATRYIKYYFEASDDTDTYWVNYYGIENYVPEEGYFEYLYTNENEVFKVPDWVSNSIFYQIFPERFCNSDKSNDPENTVGWGSKPTRENFMGGDLKGILEKLEYIKKLGINAIYLNPIFQSYSNHKYDTTNYMKIDSHLGNMEDFKELVQKLHEAGIKVILDGVFNHCGYYMEHFQDVIKNNQQSNYCEWFHIEQFPVNTEDINYECVGYFKWMPKLKMNNPAVREYLNSIAGYWTTEFGIDGWRLDVADEVDYSFWHEFRKNIKKLNPNAFLLGETWKENRDMLKGDQMDSVMNYVFRDAVVDFFAKGTINSLEFDSRINKFIGIYSRQVHYSLFNLIGSHDTARFLTLCSENENRFKLAVTFQMCFIGVPVIYYGDEIGLKGENDPDCRGAMVWKSGEQNLRVLDWYRKIINIRKSYKCLTLGIFKSIYCNQNNDVYAFMRELEEEHVYVVLNNSESDVEIELPLIEMCREDDLFQDIISDEIYFTERILCDGNYYNGDINEYGSNVKIKLSPFQVCILCKKISNNNLRREYNE